MVLYMCVYGCSEFNKWEYIYYCKYYFNFDIFGSWCCKG